MLRRKRAFTLIELLVVISIIALLLSVLLPSLNKAREIARRTVCGNHMNTIGYANQIYVNNWNDNCVPVIDTTVPRPEGTKGSFTYYCWVANKDFRDYLSLDQHNSAKYQGRYETDTILPDEFYCPSDKVAKEEQISSRGVMVSYGYNSTQWKSVMENFRWDRPTSNDISYLGYRMTKIKNPSRKLAFVDAVDWYVYWSSANPKYWDEWGQVNSDDYLNYAGVSGVTTYRHNEGANVLFFDSHVQYLSKEEIFIKKEPELPCRWTSDATGMWRMK